MRHSAFVRHPSPAVAEEGRAIAELRSLKSQRSSRAARIAQALDMLEATKSSRVRNAAALALADMRAGDTKDKLIDLLTRAETRGARGTLLYALGQLGAVVSLQILVEIIIDEPYEAREEALEFVRADRIEGSPEQFSWAEAKLEAATSSGDPERLQAVKRALGYLRTKQRALRKWRPQ